jgi:hypothetical protein
MDKLNQFKLSGRSFDIPSSRGAMSENKTVVEIHGCIVCARLFNVLAVYTPKGKLVDCTVTSSGGHIVPDERRILVACDAHTPSEIEPAYKRGQSTNDKE